LRKSKVKSSADPSEHRSEASAELVPELRTGANPLVSGEPGTWDRLIEASGPASILVWIRSRMSAAERLRSSPEDIWQETLLHAWRERERLRWQGLRAFRGLLLQIAQHRIGHEVERRQAQKRGGGQLELSISASGPGSGRSSFEYGAAGPVASTTPSRVAIIAEQADVMRRALELLADDEREVVLLRLFEDLPLSDVAARVGISLSTAKRRYLRGSAEYARRLAEILPSHGTARG
jgi:RNA polymerase sigma factor (sigma-70 family)